MAGLNLGGVDKNPATTPNGKPDNESETKPAQEEAAAGEQRDATAAQDSDAVRFSCHPILRFKIGKFRFENGLLTLREQDEIDEFRKVLDDLPLSERARIKELDVSAAEAQVRAILEQNPGATKSIDSSTGDRQPSNQVGSGTLESGAQ